jgi:hypothetical protein
MYRRAARAGPRPRRRTLAIEEDEPEVLADELSRHYKSALSGPVSGLSGR